MIVGVRAVEAVDTTLKNKVREIVLRLLTEGRPELPEGTVVKWVREDRER